jgi:non-specific serine/threonine protein kinase
VCGVSIGQVLAPVESLLDKSLIRRLPDDTDTAEFAMLESLREFAAEQLTSLGEISDVRATHAEHFAGLAVEFEASIGLPEERYSWPHWGRHHADLRAALDYCLDTGEQARTLPLAAALGWYYHTRGAVGHGQLLVDQVLALDIAQPDTPRDEREGVAGPIAGVLEVAGILALGTGQPRRAEDLLLRALATSEECGDKRRAAIACAFLGHVARAGGHWDEAAEWHRRAAEGFRQGDNAQGVAWARHDLGLLARERGDLREAETLLRASLRDFRELDYPWAVAWSAWGLGTALSAKGDLENARRLLAEALGIYGEVDDPRGVAQCLEALAEIACEQAHYQTAARLIGSAAALRNRLSAPPPDAEQERTAAVERTLARSLGPDAAARLMQTGRAMPPRQAAELGMAVALGSAPADRDRPDSVTLTRRERQVAALVSSGRTNRQIGRVLGISEKTAEVHLQHVMAKLDARNRAEVAAWAVSHHLDAPVDT